MENIVVVGTGDVFHRFIAPSLEILEYQGLLKVLSTVDIKRRTSLEYLSEKIEHRVRTADEKLSDLFFDLKTKNPVVILSHDNDFHYSDTKDLVRSGFRVMLEKPYVTNKSQLESLKKLVSENPSKIFLMEYYLMRKMAPLFLLFGAINPESFYLSTEEVFRKKETPRDLRFYDGKLEEILGSPRHLTIKILESSGDSGKLEHRGAHVFDNRRGGGMIQDMGIHALIPLFILESYIGEVDKFFTEGRVKIARSEEFDEFCKSKYTISEEFIAETYSEIDLETSQQISVKISVGKYIASTPTQKNLILFGERGKIDLDMHNNLMRIYKEHKLIDEIELVNPKRSRYYPVIRTAIEHFNGRNPFRIDLFSSQISSQELVLNIIESARKNTSIKQYKNGELPWEIFN